MDSTDTVHTARGAGLAYLGLALPGILGFLVLRPMLYVDDPAETLTNLSERTELAYLSVGLEMAIVLVQALVAIWFYRLLRPIRPVAAFAVAVFGMANAAAIMVSGMFLATAVAIAEDPSLVSSWAGTSADAPQAGAVGAIALMHTLSTSAWGMGNLFFGLWLVPMGWAALTTGRFPRALGMLLIAGGVGYVASGYAAYSLSNVPTALVTALTIPATVAEFWMIGYLLIVGIRPRTSGEANATPVPRVSTHSKEGQS